MWMKLGQRWLAGLGAATAVGTATLLGLSTMAAGQTAAPARAAKPAHAVVKAALAPAKAIASDWTPINHTLRPGDKGRDVRKVQRRLWTLGYWPGKVDGQYGPDTIEAVWAFKEVQGIQLTVNPDNIGPATERALADPKDPVPLTRHHAKNRIDVNLGGGYLVLYRHGRVRLISHISPGGGYYFCDPPPNSWPGTPRCRSASCSTRCSSSAGSSRSTAATQCRWARSRTAACASRPTRRCSSTSCSRSRARRSSSASTSCGNQAVLAQRPALRGRPFACAP
jgi:hypothetical protein